MMSSCHRQEIINAIEQLKSLRIQLNQMNTNDVRTKARSSSPDSFASLIPRTIPTQSSPSQGDSKPCHHKDSLFCHACCLMVECQECSQDLSKHQCTHQNNKHTFPVRAVSHHPAEADGTLENMKKCNRCQKPNQQLEYCLQCKHHFCSHCAKQLHAKGKFVLHVRLPLTVEKASENSQKWHSSMETSISQQEGRDYRQSNDYGFKAVQRISKLKTSMKRERRSHKPWPEQQNKDPQTKHHSDRQTLDSETTVPKQSQWFTCLRHNKPRSIITDTFENVCCECFDEMKGVRKLRAIDYSALEEDCLFNDISSYAREAKEQAQVKVESLKIQFDTYREKLVAEYNKQRQMVEERFRTNKNNLRKWYTVYESNLKSIISKSKEALEQQAKMQNLRGDPYLEWSKDLNKVKNILAHQEISKLQRDYQALTQQYQFKIGTVRDEQFQDLLKNFSFSRRNNQNYSNNAHNQRSLSKMSQSSQLRQSRMSMSIMKSDRKSNKREESLNKSNYYDLNQNSLVKRSMSRDIKEDLSQKGGFNSSGKKERRERVDTRAKKSQLFFSNMLEQYGKDSIKETDLIEIPNLVVKDVKYVNLDHILTDNQEIMNEAKAHIYTQSLTETNEMTPGRSVTQKQPSKEALAQVRMIQSVTIGNNPLMAASSTTTGSAIGKAKRKSDYMQMRDRLRKPNTIHKIKA